MAQTLSFAGSATGKVVNLEDNTWADPIRLLALGDSLTFGVSYNQSSTSTGYRASLYQNFINSGVLADFVGDRSNGGRQSGDLDHGGVPGRTADQLLAAIPNYINTYHPDVILLMIGANDVLQANAVTTVPQEIRAVIDAIHDLSPGTKIFLAELPPRSATTGYGPALSDNTEAINAQLPGLVAQLQAEGVDIVFVPTPDVAPGDLTDGTHLTKHGYGKLANEWADAVLANMAHDNGTLGTGPTNAVASDTINVDGGNGNDFIIGDSGANILRGMNGNDQLQGGGGADTLTGGAGMDWFIFKAPGDGSDTITDFDTDNDTLVFSIDGFSGAGITPGHNVPFVLSSSLTPTGTNAQFIYNPNNGRLAWDPDGTGAAPTVQLATLTGAPTLGQDDLLILGPWTNALPVIAPIPDLNVAQNQQFSYTLPPITDADGDTLSIYYYGGSTGTASLPNWLSVNYGTRTLSGTPTQAGVYTFRVVVVDPYGGQSEDVFTITVGNANTPPVVANPVANQNATEDAAFSLTFPTNTFTDANGDALTYTATLSNGSALPSWLVFNAATRTFSGTPLNGNVGTITVRITANDGRGGTVTDDFNITIANTNDAPTVSNQIADQNASEDAAFSFTVPASAFADVDVGDTLTYSATLSNGAALPAWLSFNSATRTFTGTPANGDVGSIVVRVTANDGHGGTVTDDFTINIANTNDAPTVANAVGDQAATEDAAFSFTLPANVFADVDVGDALTLSATLSNGAALPAWLTFNAATRTFSGTPDNANVGSITVRVTANDGHGGTVSDDFVITVANINDAPTVANQIADQAASEDAAFSFTVPANAFADVDLGDALTYSATLSSGATLPAWLSFNPATRTFTGTPTNGDVGSIVVRVTANDGNGGTAADDFSINIANTNDAPTVAAPIVDQAATEDAGFGFTLPAGVFADVDVGDTLALSATLSSGAALPAWLSFNPATRTFSGTPTNGDVGSITVRVTANDGHGGTITDDFVITVANTNDAPTVSAPIADQAANETSPFSFTVPANAFADVDAGDTLSYSATLSNGSALPAWLSFNATTRTFSGTPANGDVGSITVRVTANDGHGGTVSDDFVIVISNANDAPTVAQPIADQGASEDAAFSFTLPAGTFADDDAGDVLTLSATLANGSALPSWLVFNAATRTFSGTPTNGDVGAITVRVTANDGHGGTVSDDFVITVANTNDAPTVANAIANQAATEDAAFSFTFAANVFADVDAGDVLSYFATLSNGAALPAWLVFNAATRTFSGTPTNGDVGAITVRVTANDGRGGTITDDFVITVANTNDAPTLANAIADQGATEDAAFSFTVPSSAFADVDVGDVLAYSATLSNGAALPSWLSFNATTRTFTGTPLNANVGPITVRVTVNDGHGGTTFDDFVINVANTNDAPTVATPIADQAATRGAAFSFTVSAGAFADVDVGDVLALSATLSSGSALPSWLSFNPATRTFSGTPGVGDVGVITVRVTANDGHGGTVSDDFVLTINQTNSAPTVANPVPDQATPEDAAFSYTLPANTFSDADGDGLALSAALAAGGALPAWLSFNAATRTFSGTPPANFNGSLTVRVTADDGHGGSITDDFVINVTPVNDAPTVANLIADQASAEDAALSFTLPANIFADIEGDALTLSAALTAGGALPAWLSFNAATRTFSGTPPLNFNGTVAVRVTANDGNGGSAFDDFVITITPVNDAPTVAAPIADQPATEDAAFSYIVPAGAFADVDGDVLSYSATLSSGAALPSWLTFNAATRTFTGTPLNADVGAITVRVTVSDGKGGTTFDDFVINVANTNDAPTVAAPIADRSTGVGLALSYQVPAGAFADVDVGDVLTYSAVLSSGAALPAWLTFNPTTRTFTGTPAAGNVGAITVRVTANDGHGGVVFDDFIITVTGGTNTAPRVATAIPDRPATEDIAFTYQVGATAFTDADGDALTYTALRSNGTALPAWLVFDPITRTFSGTPLAADVGTITVRVTASDGRGGTIFDDFIITVGATQSIAGTANADIMTGGAGNNELHGAAGNDTINGLAGNDKLYGDAGNDTINGGDGADQIWGGTNDDLINGDAGNDILRGEDGNDTIYGGLGDDQLYGNGGDNFMYGGDGVDMIAGGSGRDTIYGGAGNDDLRGGDGVNIIYGEDGNDIIVGGDYEDTMDGGAGDDTFNAGLANDFVFGGTGNDTLYGENGADRLNGGLGNDTIYTGAGNDRVQFGLADMANGETDRIMDFGDVANNQDVIEFIGVSASAVTMANVTGGVNLLVNLGGGQTFTVFVSGMTTATIADDLLFT